MPNTDKEQFSVYINSYQAVLLKEVAERHDRSFSNELEIAIREYLLRQMDQPEFWEEVYRDKGLKS